ncbi:hypothetical protein GOP47_0028287 [Adiantum capillus-veneris]|nr:hypothetical protein GOP47_0028287 [Adiantum capillus-veneris]
MPTMSTVEQRILFVFVNVCIISEVGDVYKWDMEERFLSLLAQPRRGSYLPSKDHVDLKVDFFTFAPDRKDHMKAADLVISHAGSGSIFETLRMGKPLIVVVNEA